MKNDNIIHEFFIRNGFVKIIVDIGERPIKIKHVNMLHDKFFEYFEQLD